MTISTARRGLKKKNRKNHSKGSHPNLIELWTKGVEIGFLVSSLLWAVEVSAKEAIQKEATPVWAPRTHTLMTFAQEVSLPTRAPASTQIIKTEKPKTSKSAPAARELK